MDYSKCTHVKDISGGLIMRCNEDASAWALVPRGDKSQLLPRCRWHNFYSNYYANLQDALAALAMERL